MLIAAVILVLMYDYTYVLGIYVSVSPFSNVTLEEVARSWMQGHGCTRMVSRERLPL